MVAKIVRRAVRETRKRNKLEQMFQKLLAARSKGPEFSKEILQATRRNGGRS
ncbi:MAG: hypothetical protein U1F11_01165 [Steroidobacteraceae bacterium]